MLSLGIEHGDILQFTLEDISEKRRIHCIQIRKGQMQLHERSASGFLLDRVATLYGGHKESAQFAEIWPDTKLKYYKNELGVWRVAFDMPDGVRVERIGKKAAKAA